MYVHMCVYATLTGGFIVEDKYVSDNLAGQGLTYVTVRMCFSA